MDTISLFTNVQNVSLTALFFKAFAVLFAFMYLVYAVVISRQTRVMNETLIVNSKGTISFISTIQIFVGIILVLLAIFIV